MRMRKTKHFSFTSEEFLKNREEIMKLPYENHEGYDSCWVRVEGDEEHNGFSFGTHHGSPAEATFEELVKDRQKILDKLFELEEVVILGEDGKPIFIMQWC